MPKRFFTAVLVLVAAAGASAFAGTLSECTRNIPVSSHFYTSHIVRKGEGCALNSSYAYTSAQNVMVTLCASLRGRYRAEAQNIVCDGEAMPLKVSEGLSGFIEVSGVCSIEGFGTCEESGPPVFWGTHHE